MIVHEASGGLGNQLFNYAAARTLADRHDTGLLIDAVHYKNQWNEEWFRRFLLHRFPVRARFRNLSPTQRPPGILARLRRRIGEDVLSRKVSRPPLELKYFEEFSKLGPRTVLRGHFISPRFFAGNEARIREDLRLGFEDLQSPESQAVYREIEATACSVSVHVRGGDTRNTSNAWLQLPDPIAYYRNAIGLLQKRRSDAVFFVFSDDPDWCREVLTPTLGRFRLVSERTGGEAHPLDDFVLMSRCRHAIIANSAFSWWAGWLIARPSPIVVAPSRWEGKGLIDTEELLPEAWTRLQV